MKITFVMAGGFGLSGGDRVIATYAKHLRQRGHEVFVVARPVQPLGIRKQIRSWLTGNRVTSQKQLPSHFDHLGVPHQLIDSYRPVQDQDVPDADVVIATWWETAEWIAKLSPAKGAKVYFVQHHEVFDYLPKAQVEASYLLPLHKIVVSQWLADVMQTMYGDHHVSLVRNSVDINQFIAPPRGKQPVPTFGIMYSMLPWKGCEFGLQAFSIAAQRRPGIRLVAFGQKAPLPHLPLPPETEYIQSPPPQMLKEIYARCDAWLFSSKSEGFGLPILEAMACRTPVIATPAGAAPELLASGGGLLASPHGPEEMAKRIEQICDLSNEAWQTMSQVAYDEARYYTWSDATADFEAALKTAIEQQPQRQASCAIAQEAC
ncbi:MAG: glycosyltransferase family 4 protein [Elainellaceae cyanobacterium]